MESEMYCFQCQEAIGNIACMHVGACGKQPKTAMLQDGLLFVTKGLCEVVTIIRGQGKTIDCRVNELVIENLCVTITNANFDNDVILKSLCETLEIKKALLQKVDACVLSDDALWYSNNKEEIYSKSKLVGILSACNEDLRSIRELITYGLKGMAAYYKQASRLLHCSDDIISFIQRALAKTLDVTITMDELLELTLEVGRYGVSTMSLLDEANTKLFGSPEMTTVRTGVSNKPAILVSGHELKDLEMLLEQTQGTGIDVYTHCEMLPAHYYPKLKKYKNLIGNYGSAWWNQNKEFETFNGPILLTTNCLVPPTDSYKDRLYTTGTVGFSGCDYIEEENHKKDFSKLIQHAKKLSAPSQIEHGEIVGGFAHNQVIALSDTIAKAIKSGAIKKFIVMAGCDGRSKSRNYYTDFARAVPENSVILTAGCAKFKYNKLPLGEIQGIPRVLDAGQCNDSYSLVKIALTLKDLLELDDINDFPIVYNISWYEQKAVIVLLALLFLGVKNIHLGPTLPAFLSPNIITLLYDNFGITGIQTVEEDIKKLFNKEKSLI